MKVWHYKIQSTGAGEGWAHVMIREDGFFATVSDYGNYAYWWTATGKKDVREFFLRAEDDWHYFAKKLRPDTQLDQEASFDRVLQDIREERRRGDLTKEEARERYEHVKWFGRDDWEGFLRDEDTNRYWDEVWDFTVRTLSADVVCYTQKILPKVAKLIEAELAAERASVAEDVPLQEPV